MPLITLIQRPHIFCFSKNPVQYQFTVDDYAVAGSIIYLQVYMKAVTVVGAGDFIYQENIKPSSAVTTINLQDIIDANLTYQLPDFLGPVIQNYGGNVKEFYIRYAYNNDADEVIVWSTEITKIRYVIKGGIAFPEWDWNNYFIYLRSSKAFLTWQPNNCFVGLADVFFISYLNTVASVPLTLKVNIEYSDGTSAVINHAFADSGELRLYHFGAGVNQLGIDVTKQVYRYTLQVVETATPATIFAGPFTYYIDYRQFYYTKFFHYYNSLGGLQYTRIRGDIEYEVPRSFTESELYHGMHIIGSPASEQYTQSGITKIDTYKGETGFIHTRAEHDVLQELLVTLFAWERIINKNLRIYITQRGAKMGSTADKKQSLALEWRYSFSNQVYTPFMDLGVGIEEDDYLPECIPLLMEGTPVLPDCDSAAPYSYAISFSGTLPLVLSDIVKPAWMVILVSESMVNFSGTPAVEDEAIGVNVSFTITNDCGTLDFADTIDVTAPGMTPVVYGFNFIANPAVAPGDYWPTVSNACAATGSGYGASSTVYLNPSAVDGSGQIIGTSPVWTDAAATLRYNDTYNPNFIGFRVLRNATTGIYQAVGYQCEIGLASIAPETC